MSQITFFEIATLINFSRSTQIDLQHCDESKGRWQLHKAAHVVHTSKYPFFVLYVLSDATQGDIEQALKRVPAKSDEVHLVYPDTQAKNVNKVTGSPHWEHIKNKWSTRDFILSFIKVELESYLEKLRSGNPHDYIDPRIETPSGLDRKIPNPLLGYLTDPQTSNQPSSGTLAIVLAEAGQGKTYMSRYLVGQLANPTSKVFPIFVDSSQWRGLTLEDQRSLAKTITHSFRHFGSAISWIEGHEEEFLRITLKADIFRIVFDGFDEFVLRNHGEIQPVEVLETLAALAKETSSRIIITSRISFWETNLPESEVDSFFAQTQAYKYVIKAFDANHATNYFKKALKTPSECNRAVDLFRRLSAESHELTGRGFALSLVADLVRENTASNASPEDGEGTLGWLMEKLCERESLRQNLPFDGKTQIKIFKLFAKEVAEGAIASTAFLGLCMQTVCDTLHSKIIDQTIESFKSHPLLHKSNDHDLWSFSQEQILIGLLALQIEEWSRDETEGFLDRAKLEAEQLQDLGSFVVEFLHFKGKATEQRKRFRSVVAKLSAGWGESFRPGVVLPEGRRLAGIVALLAVERLMPAGSSHHDRAQALLGLTGERDISKMYFSGTISRYDFKGLTFNACLFNRVTWINCSFDEATVFQACKFHGGIAEHCVGLGGVVRKHCKLDPDAEKPFAAAEVKEGRRKYSETDLRSDIDALVGKFVIPGGIGLKTVAEQNILKGAFAHSKFRREILDAFECLVLDKHHLRNAEGYNVKPTAIEAVKFYASNNVLTGPLEEARKRLSKRLLK